MGSNSQAKRKFSIDLKTKKGTYADGFGVQTSENMGIIDFVFNAPDEENIIVSRVVMRKEVLFALGKFINEVYKDENGEKKEKAK
jgi:hypothetical protein